MSFSYPDSNCRICSAKTHRTLGIAGFYYLVLGILCWVNPSLIMDFCEVAIRRHPLMVGMFGCVLLFEAFGLFLIAQNPQKHWSLLLILALKNIVFIIGLMVLCFQRLEWYSITTLLIVLDFIWLVFFLKILTCQLMSALRLGQARKGIENFDEVIETYYLSTGESLSEASQDQLLVVVFLRHFGCTFTRQLLKGLESLKREADKHRARLVMIHMLEEGKERAYLQKDSNHLATISDTKCELYRAFGLGKAGFLELFGPQVLWRGAIALVRGCGFGLIAGNGLQMPGAFLFKDGKILKSQRSKNVADLPDLHKLFDEESI